MKAYLTILIFLIVESQIFAQPIICSGTPLTGINGANYDSVTSTGTGGCVASSKDGKLFATSGGKIKYISTTDFSIIDSMAFGISYIAGGQSNDTMFGLKLNGTLCQFNMATKAFIDSLPISGLSHNRSVERPYSKEVWINGTPLTVVNYNNNLTVSNSLAVGANIVSVKFSTDGHWAYCNSYPSKIYVIDAMNKVLTDSFDLYPESPTGIELSSDDSKLFAIVSGKVKVYQVSNFALVDSVDVTMQTDNIFRHPSKPEVWCVHHFRDSVTVFNMNPPYNLVDSLRVGNNPYFLAFGLANTGIDELEASADICLYPNPVYELVNIETEIENGEIELYDGKGAVVRRLQFTKGKQAVYVGALPAGLYFVSVRDAAGKKSVAKFNKL
jgi:hypothetical protein